jgi:hypothetical protein
MIGVPADSAAIANLDKNLPLFRANGIRAIDPTTPIVVEFSCIRWAPNHRANKSLKDVTGEWLDSFRPHRRRSCSFRASTGTD